VVDIRGAQWRRHLGQRARHVVEVLRGDVGLVLYLQQLLGYCLSGLTTQHLLPIAYGLGCNGKSTLTNVMLGLLGDYGAIANQELLMPE
jgi:putative DNA primase/helicase